MRTFYLLLGNTVIAAVTNMTVWFAITFFAYLETRSVFATSIIGGLYLVMIALSGVWFGSLVDHYRKKQVMLASSLVSLLLYLAVFVIHQAAAPDAFKDVGSVTLWLVVVTLMVGVIVGNIRMIALPTLVTMLIPEDQRDKANGLVGTATGLALLVTSVISGVLVGLGGMYYVLTLAIALTLLTIVHLWFIEVSEPEAAHREAAPKRVDIRGTVAVIAAVPGLIPLILFTTFNNFLGGVYMALMDAYGLSLVSVQAWGFLWGVLSLGFIVGGLAIARWGLGRSPLRAMFLANIVIWTISIFFTVIPSIMPLAIGMFVYFSIIPFIEAAEQTIIQKVVPAERQGRVFGFAQSVEQAASPLTAFMIGPIAQFIAIPFMSTGAGVGLIGSWFGVGADRGIALVFTVTGVIGLCMTVIGLRSPYYRQLSRQYASPDVAEVPSVAHLEMMSPAVIPE
ncbi:MAG: MFS transporter [Chloroflexi bacterium]|nr:MFS transporter [Chloroflexota bacterium]